ncbi:hypothetical protein D7Y13_07850 [Corallococcus praedator]|uniref:Uncharacterized protein n=1 Tax=Corallococcus praedator TaxID=2316724 RepID=A0ABX9QPB9_9BACT|nr:MULTISPECIES: hypothetical protein [Corallococcus]NNB86113.1 hypothetical protein [Corallococcus exiguus]RKH35654.1 hypothetical protein D7X75_03470 [Corallococcus sp. CA031C]RKI13339.1 hypothetical protein D7Y13_07850 [Corallococcus praedator]
MQATSTPPPTSPPTPEGNATTQESTSTAKAEATPVVWPRDLNLPTSGELTWGFDPEGLQDG